MPNLSTEAIFILVKSLERAEKRNFKLYVKRNSASADLKTIQLFDALDKMKVYDEEELLRKNESISKQQLSNLKAHLYDQVLASLRVVKQSENIDLQIHEQLDHAKILYNIRAKSPFSICKMFIINKMLAIEALQIQSKSTLAI